METKKIYDLVEAGDTDDLVVLVNARIQEGYEIVGGVFVFFDPIKSEVLYLQSITITPENLEAKYQAAEYAHRSHNPSKVKPTN